MSNITAKLSQLGISLPQPPQAAGNYVPAVRTGNLVFLSGVVSALPDGDRLIGKVGKDLTVEQAYEGARMCALNLLANLKNEIGDLDKIKRVVKLLGMVNADPGFTQSPQVINGCSDLLVDLLGEKGKHARSAVGVTALPLGFAVEIEAIVELDD